MDLKYVFLSVVCWFHLTMAIFEPVKSLDPDCNQARDAFANASSVFISCSINNSHPVTFCGNCVSNYINVLATYKNMSTVKNNGTSCIENFVNLDRLGIVQTMYQSSVNLWSRAKCNDCFVTEKGFLTERPSNVSKQFKEYYHTFESCINSSAYECSECLNSYTNLQNYFLSFSSESEKIGTCMDLVDMMNNTWTYWGQKCCRFRKHKEITFISSVVSVLVGTVLFYIVVQLYAKKRQPTIMEQNRFLSTLES
ncbi:osteopetrosis-associated transmembrane protein 1 [Anthonomus grandis grandis]|uniref:osteopetrosis-associated transmembrane protein 1 n=1 Tax=Anthonomus grandis grandis TaxID=2921223 RepID=UPI00216562DC|nr:osteopetrosis-associated transmembrane protein 1 [Anthonomus grandis grandis]